MKKSYLEHEVGVIYVVLMVTAFLLCMLFLYKVLGGLIHICSKKGKKLIQRLRKSKFFQKKKAVSPRSESVTSKTNGESIRRRNRNAVRRSPQKREEGPARISYRNDSNSIDNKNRSGNTSKYSVLSLDWKDHYDSDEKDE